MPNGRVQVPTDLQFNNKLSPQASPVDTYAAPAKAPVDNSLDRLSQALSGFSTTLGNYEQVAAYKEKVAAKDDLELQQAKIGGMSHQQIVEARTNGTLYPHQDPLTVHGIDAITGQREGVLDNEDLRQRFKTEYDPAKDGPPENWVDNQVRDKVNGMGKVTAASYYRQIGDLKDWTRQYLVEDANKKTVVAQHNAGFNLVSDVITKGVQANTSAEDIVKDVEATRHQMGTNGVLGQQEDDINENVMAAATNAIKSRPEVAIQLLSNDRYMKDTRYAARAEEGIVAAKKQIEFAKELNWTNSLGPLGAQSIVDRKPLPVADLEYTKPDGTKKTVSVEEFKKQAVKSYMDGSPDIATKRNEDPSQKVWREYADLNRQGLKHPQMTADVNGLAPMLSPSTLKDPETKAEVLRRMNTGIAILNDSQGQLSNYVQKQEDLDAISVYDAWKTLASHKDGSGYTDEEALTAASEVNHPVQGANTNLTPDDKQAVDDAMGSIMQGKHWYSWGDTPANSSAIQNKVEYLMRSFIAHGSPHDQAAEMAVHAVQRSSLIYNGVMLPKVNGFATDDDFQPAVKSYIDGVVKANPKMVRDGIDPADIAIFPMGNVNGNSGGHFRLIDKSTLEDVLDDNHNQVIFHVNDLRKKSAADRQDRNRAAEEKAANKK
jgi:hypothetical protein